MKIYEAWVYTSIDSYIMTEKEIKNLFKKQQQGNLTEQEEAILVLFEKKLKDKNQETVFRNERYKSIVGREIYTKVLQHKKKSHNLVWMQVAAAITILLAVVGVRWFGFNTSEQAKDSSTYIAKTISYQTNYGQKRTLILPDGSKVKLNSGSKITFPKQFNDSIREVNLSGEAFFEVKKDPDHPFIVKTSMLSTRVLGTSFNINAFKESDGITVTLATGKVKVSVQNQEDVLLTPSYQMVYQKSTKQTTKQKVDLQKALGWKNGVLRFDNETLVTAIPKLEKWFGVQIKLANQDAKDCSFTGAFKQVSLQSVLENITFVKKGLTYEFVSDKEVIIKGICIN